MVLCDKHARDLTQIEGQGWSVRVKERWCGADLALRLRPGFLSSACSTVGRWSGSGCFHTRRRRLMRRGKYAMQQASGACVHTAVQLLCVVRAVTYTRPPKAQAH